MGLGVVMFQAQPGTWALMSTQSATVHPKDERMLQQNSTTPSTEEWALVHRMKAGDEQAFREVYHLYAPRLLKRVKRMVGDDDMSLDCVQQIFTEAIHSIHQFSGKGSLHAWLNRIATTTVLDMFRKRRRWEHLVGHVKTLAFDWVSGAVEPSRPLLPTSLFYHEERMELLCACMEKMTPHKRMAVTLCELEGYTIEEAAQALALPTGTMASRLYHGKRELAQLLRHALSKQGITVEEWLDE